MGDGGGNGDMEHIQQSALKNPAVVTIARRRVGRGGGETTRRTTSTATKKTTTATQQSNSAWEREGLMMTAAIGSWRLATLTRIDGDGDRP
jgi:hypothetical protein